MQSGWMKTRQTKYTLYVTIYLLVIVGILAPRTGWPAGITSRRLDLQQEVQPVGSDRQSRERTHQDVTITVTTRPARSPRRGICLTGTPTSPRS